MSETTIPGTLRWPHWSHVRPGEWRWPNFTPQEVACKGTGELLVNPHALDKLQKLREAMGHPLIVVSGYRSEAHNARVGGVPNSAHRLGAAFDISVVNADPETLIRAARGLGFTGIGTYPRQGFVHVDTGAHLLPADRSRARAWGDAFPPRDAGRFAPEPAPRPVLATREGQAAAWGVTGLVSSLATAAPQLVEAAQHPLASVVPLVGGALAVLALVALVVRAVRRARAEKDGADA